jgi:hypothetical protein
VLDCEALSSTGAGAGRVTSHQSPVTSLSLGGSSSLALQLSRGIPPRNPAPPQKTHAPTLAEPSHPQLLGPHPGYGSRRGILRLRHQADPPEVTRRTGAPVTGVHAERRFEALLQLELIDGTQSGWVGIVS